MSTESFGQYEITVNNNTESASFPYKELKFQNILLNNYYELPQNVTWSTPRMSPNKQYIGAKATNRNGTETVYIWSAFKNDFGKKFLYEYTHSKILTFDFSSISTSFVIVYKGKPPVYYNIKSGHKIKKLDTKNMDINDCLSWAFSPGGRFFALCTSDHFYVWDVITSELKIHFEEKSPKKFLRNDTLILINRDNDLILRNINGDKPHFQMNLPNIRSPSDVLACSISEDNQFVYYATKECVTKVNLKERDTDEKIYFEELNPSLVYISNDCQQYLTTNYSDINVWEIGRDQIFSTSLQKFNDMMVSFGAGLMMFIDNISIILQDIDSKSKTREEITLFKVFTDRNPTKFQTIEYTYNSQFVLCWIDNQSAALYNCSTGNIVHKWVNPVDNWGRALQLAPILAAPSILATKTSKDVIQVWDYSNGVCIVALKGFDVYDIKFNSAGNILAAGTVGGTEIARVWDLDYPLKPFSFRTDNSKQNKHTVVFITDNKKFLICHAQFQNPLVFNTATCKMLYECKCDTKFSYIENILCSDITHIFVSYGKSSTNKQIGCYWKVDTSEFIEELNDCTYVEMSVSDYNFLNVYEDKVKIMNTKKDEKTESYEINKDNAVAYRILNDSKGFTRKYSNDNNKTIQIVANNIHTGELISDLTYKQLNDDNILELDMIVDKDNCLNLRRLKFRGNEQ